MAFCNLFLHFQVEGSSCFGGSCRWVCPALDGRFQGFKSEWVVHGGWAAMDGPVCEHGGSWVVQGRSLGEHEFALRGTRWKLTLWVCERLGCSLIEGNGPWRWLRWAVVSTAGTH